MNRDFIRVQGGVHAAKTFLSEWDFESGLTTEEYEIVYQNQEWQVRKPLCAILTAAVWKAEACDTESLESRPRKRRGIPDVYNV